MISELRSPVMVMELFIVITVRKNTALAIEPWSFLPLSTHANYLVVSNLVSTLLANRSTLACVRHRAHSLELFLGHEFSIVADLPIDDYIDTLQLSELIENLGQPFELWLLSCLSQDRKLDLVRFLLALIDEVGRSVDHLDPILEQVFDLVVEVSLKSLAELVDLVDFGWDDKPGLYFKQLVVENADRRVRDVLSSFIYKSLVVKHWPYVVDQTHATDNHLPR